MGPRLFSRGDPPGCSPPRSRHRGFNGATAFQPWRRRASTPQVTHLLASMGPRLFSRGDATSAARSSAARPASMGPRLFSRGDVHPQQRPGVQLHASMGPRLFSRGDIAWLVTDSKLVLPASMGPRLFSRGDKLYVVAVDPGKGSFNGATAFQPWRLANKVAPAGGNALQWGHGFSAVETAMATLALNAMSMLQWGHGFSAVETPRLYSLSFRSQGFNGATAFQPWRRSSRPAWSAER